MLKLGNITREGNIVSAVVTTVEVNPQTFEVAVDIETKEILKNTLGEMNMYSRMAISKLFALANEHGNKIPKESGSAWY